MFAWKGKYPLGVERERERTNIGDAYEKGNYGTQKVFK